MLADAPEFGIMKTNEENLITSFIEKPKSEVLGRLGKRYWRTNAKRVGKNYLASMGIYIFNRKVLFDFLQNVHPDATDFGKEIIPDSIANYTCY
ncbi:MAG: sugar phosphate nucleotidyltransferase [Chitinophagaceae bacterium]